MSLEYKPNMSPPDYVLWCVETTYLNRQRELSARLFTPDQRGESIYDEGVENQKSELAVLHTKTLEWLKALLAPKTTDYNDR
jgi:hypothetical protein